jgi:hypothetical protein
LPKIYKHKYPRINFSILIRGRKRGLNKKYVDKIKWLILHMADRKRLTAPKLLIYNV